MVEKNNHLRVRFDDCCENIVEYHTGYLNKGCEAPRQSAKLTYNLIKFGSIVFMGFIKQLFTWGFTL